MQSVNKKFFLSLLSWLGGQNVAAISYARQEHHTLESNLTYGRGWSWPPTYTELGKEFFFISTFSSSYFEMSFV